VFLRLRKANNMLKDLLCLLRYGKTVGSLMEKQGISLLRVSEEVTGSDKEWGACSDIMEFDYGHRGVWGEGDTPYEALVDCMERIKTKKGK